MNGVRTLVAAFVLAGLTAIPTGAAAKPEKTSDDRTAVVEGNSQFALDLYARLRGDDGNLFFSPYSISTALAMTYAGARGETAKQMAETLHFTLEQERLHPAFGAMVADLNARAGKGYELIVANALWGQKGYGFLAEFLSLTKRHYGAGLNEVDFIEATEAARKTINAWVEEKTRDKIKDLIPQGVLDKLTRLVLTNAIYFKGNWASQFEAEQTEDTPFTLLSGEKADVPMMNKQGTFNYLSAEEFQAIEMPYVGNDLSVLVFLPKKTDGLAEFEKSLTDENLRNWIPRFRRRAVIVGLPKFKMTSQFSLADVLKSMGMKNAFTGDADFSGMNGKRDLFISAVIHKAFVEVNEEGTEAAAATAVVVATTAVSTEPVKIPVFRADHPFLFMIRDTRTNSILFLGRVMDPRS